MLQDKMVGPQADNPGLKMGVAVGYSQHYLDHYRLFLFNIFSKYLQYITSRYLGCLKQSIGKFEQVSKM